MSKQKELDDDARLFRSAVGVVKPLSSVHQSLSKPQPQPIPRQHHLDERAALEELLLEPPHSQLLELNEHLSYRRSGVQASVLRKLRRGNFRVQAELDLHGWNARQARRELLDFLREAQRRELRCVSVIHGKGRKEVERAPVLKPLVEHWLPNFSGVLAFCSARPQDGGTGAVYVLLNRGGSA